MAEQLNEILTTRQFAQKIRVTPETVRRWCRDGKITPLKTTTGHYRFTEAHVSKILNGGKLSNRAQDIAIHIQACGEKIRRLRRRV